MGNALLARYIILALVVAAAAAVAGAIMWLDANLPGWGDYFLAIVSLGVCVLAVIVAFQYRRPRKL